MVSIIEIFGGAGTARTTAFLAFVTITLTAIAAANDAFLHIPTHYIWIFHVAGLLFVLLPPYRL
jgi:hypothetical protein